MVIKSAGEPTEDAYHGAVTPKVSQVLTVPKKIKNVIHEVVRYPSLTFVEGAGAEQDSNTAIKSANLKSELIIDENSSQNLVGKHLFDNSSAHSIASLDSESTIPVDAASAVTSTNRFNPFGSQEIISSSSASFITSDYITANTVVDSKDNDITAAANSTGGTLTRSTADTDIMTVGSRKFSVDTRTSFALPMQPLTSANYLYTHQRHGTEFSTNPSMATSEETGQTYQSLLHQVTVLKNEPKSMEEESFIYHDANPDLNSGLVFHTRRSSRFSYAESEYAEGHSGNVSPVSRKRVLVLDDPLRSIQISQFPQLSSSSSLRAPNSGAPSPTTLHVKRQPIVSHVRQVSQRLFSNSNTDVDRRSFADDSTSTTLCRTPLYKNSAENKQRLCLSPIDDYDIDEAEELNEVESLLSRPFRKSGYSQTDRFDQTPYRYGSVNITKNTDDDGDADAGGDFVNETGYCYNSPHNYKSMYYRQNLILKVLKTTLYVFFGILLFFASIRLVVLKNCDNSLSNLTLTSLNNVLMSNELLLFEVTASATNKNFQDVNIWSMDVDVFMQTDSELLDASSSKSDIAILLGNSTSFITPLKFQGIFNTEETDIVLTALPERIWHRLTHKSEIAPQSTSGQVKIQYPGKSFRYKGEPLNSDQWGAILNSKFKLIVRGSFNYHLPLMSNNEVVSVTSEVNVKPEK
ncbi:hypothetical protein FOA43_003929 [Brettanomyces nanus]|uniref:Uncharacterized protein n=1 Tax=Eeniella nana TaxID=13502 RepID=A0A875RQC8_EENNA|nr:uncharacterized protein FOA43_003929 [Brettanomyces nanus]QPG76540.1 hypothetical protein FOA43_003929 [Brettanomyces nanus]